MKLNLTPISSKRFTFCRQNNMFVADRSDFGLESRVLEQRIYDDACDVGFTMESSKTGMTVTYYHSYRHIEDGDIKWDDYSPLRGDVRKVPSTEGTTVRIFND